MRIRYTAFLLAPLALAAACGGDDAATTTAAAATTAAGAATTAGAVDATTAPIVEATTAPAAGGGAGALSDRCLELWGQYARTIEPIVSQVDWTDVVAAEAAVASITPALETAVAPLDAEFDAEGCNDLNTIDAETSAQLLEVTAAEAPGAVPFVEFVLLASAEMTA